MASPSSHEKLCEPCQQKKNKTKVRSFCFECQELLCKDCSDIYLTFKISRNHNLIDLIPLTKNSIKADSDKERRNFTEDNAENSSDFVDDELSSDFLDHMTLTKDTILYGAQVAVERSEASLSDLSSSTIDPKGIKLNGETVYFNTLREDDTAKLPITGVITLSDEVIVVSTSDKLKFFDQSGTYLSSHILREVISIYAIALVRDDTFIVGGTGSKVQLCTRYKHGFREGKTYDVGHSCDAICFNGAFYGVLHERQNIITVLDGEGTLVRKFSISDVNKEQLIIGNGIEMDRTTNHIYLPCLLKGILCKSITGETLWFKSFPSTCTVWDITDVYGVLCVAHCTKHCLELMSKNGDYIGALSTDKEKGSPEYLHFCERTEKLYVTYGRESSSDKLMGRISIFKIMNK